MSKLTLNELNNRLEENNSTFRVLRESENPEMLVCHCNKCGQTYEHKRVYVKYARSCPVCSKKIIIPYINDLYADFSEIVPYLKNKEDAHKYSRCSNKKVMLKCPKCGYERALSISNVQKTGFICPVCDRGKCGKLDFEAIKMIVHNKAPFLSLRLIGNGRIEYTCQNCGYIFSTLWISSRDVCNCPACSGHRTAPGINTIDVKEPWMEKYFKDEEYRHNNTPTSNRHGVATCPDCGKTKLIRPNDLKRWGFHCDYCSDGVSYPNKFIRYLFEQIPVDYVENEYTRDWTNCKSYDLYFEYKSKKYFVEMDGRFHYIDVKGFGSFADDIKKNDEYKDLIAMDHGIEMIRIDCLEPSKDYIKNNILSSKLAEIFDLSNIDWDACDLKATKSIVIQASEDYNSGMSMPELDEKYKVTRGSMINYLKRGHDLGICDYTPEHSRQRSDKNSVARYAHSNGQIWEVYDKENNFIGKYFSLRMCAEDLKQKFNQFYNSGKISKSAQSGVPYKDLKFKNLGKVRDSYSYQEVAEILKIS